MKLLSVHIDNMFRQYFKNLKQVFLSITNSCNLYCSHCLYKPWLKSGEDMNFDEIIALLSTFREMGAEKLSLLGGEPTLYGKKQGKSVSDIVAAGKKLGYKYIRIVTNGIYRSELLEDPKFSLVDEISYSIESHKMDIHDFLRGKGSYEKTINNMIKSITLGYKVDITSCVFSRNILKTNHNNYSIIDTIKWAESLGVSRINFHPILKMGISRDSWVGNVFISPDDWKQLYSDLKAKINLGLFNIPVRLPQRFVSQEEYSDNQSYYDYCPVRMGERVEVHPNGQIQICALLKGTNYSIARYVRTGNEIHIYWEKLQNELNCLDFKKSNFPCTLMGKNFGDYIPLCISFKPGQDEYIWNKLEIDKKVSINA